LVNTLISFNTPSDLTEIPAGFQDSQGLPYISWHFGCRTSKNFQIRNNWVREEALSECWHSRDEGAVCHQLKTNVW